VEVTIPVMASMSIEEFGFEAANDLQRRERRRIFCKEGEDKVVEESWCEQQGRK
jgi:hypothetical protein